MNSLDPTVIKQLDQLPPHSVEAEMCVLASLMLADRDKKLFAETRAKLSREAFFQADHQIIFDVIVSLADKSIGQEASGVDYLLVREELIRRQLLEDVGGVSYLAELANRLPTAVHGPHYAGVVREKYQLRQLIISANNILHDAYAPADENKAGAIAMKHAADLARVAASGQAHRIHTMKEVIERFLEDRTSEQDVGFVKTGLTDLDKVIGGLRTGRFTIVGGRASMGNPDHT